MCCVHVLRQSYLYLTHVLSLALSLTLHFTLHPLSLEWKTHAVGNGNAQVRKRGDFEASTHIAEKNLQSKDRGLAALKAMDTAIRKKVIHYTSARGRDLRKSLRAFDDKNSGFISGSDLHTGLY